MNAIFTSDAADSSAESSLICAVDIGGSKFEAGLVTLKGELVDRARVEVDPDVGPQSHLRLSQELLPSRWTGHLVTTAKLSAPSASDVQGRLNEIASRCHR